MEANITIKLNPHEFNLIVEALVGQHAESVREAGNASAPAQIRREAKQNAAEVAVLLAKMN